MKLVSGRINYTTTNKKMEVTINITDEDVELLEPWLDEFVTTLYTNPADPIVHEVLAKLINKAKG